MVLCTIVSWGILLSSARSRRRWRHDTPPRQRRQRARSMPAGYADWPGARPLAFWGSRPDSALHQHARDHGRCVPGVERQFALAQRHVVGGDAVEAAQVLGPGFILDLLDIARGVGDIVL